MGVNKVILIGNVGGDPVCKTTPSGTELAKFSLATTDRRRKDERGNPATEWHSIVAFGKLATAVIRPYVKKGSKLYLEGSIHTRTYEKDGIKRYFTEIHADQLELLGDGSPKSAGHTTQDDDGPVPF